MHDALRQHIRKSLTGDFPAHASFQDAVADWPHDQRGIRPEGLPYSGWELIEHIRLAQADLLRYSQNDDYVPDTWPDAYWPDAIAPPSRNAWHTSCETVVSDRETLLALLDESDPFEPVPTHDTHTLLRSALIVLDHNAYHVGQLVAVRRLLGCWPPADTA